MKNKIFGFFMCMLVMTMIPVAAGATTNPNPQPSKIGWTTLQGFIFGLKEINGGALLEFRCIFIHYVSNSISERTTGFRYGGQMMVIPGSLHGVLLPHLIIGWYPSVLEF